MLVLAGPGSGKTKVLTCRIARLLDESRDQRFRILALTFTNKAVDEMKDRVSSFVPEFEDRVNIFTFHSFCSQVLRQHGVHIGLKPNFRIYSRTEDRHSLLRDAMRGDSVLRGHETHQFLPLIDRLKAKLISPQEAVELDDSSRKNYQSLTRAYQLYEEELRQANALDFNSLIFEAYKLFAHPVLARHYQNIYKYWLIDEFQDTNDAQYRLLKRMAADNFQEIFAVADDDQTIYEWNGANVRRISTLASDFDCNVIQLPTNFRCPPQIVEIANRLVVYNEDRLENKQPSRSIQRQQNTSFEPIQYRVFATDIEEAAGIAREIADMTDGERSRTAVLARSRSLLQSVHDKLKEEDMSSVMLMRRDDFVSPIMRWLIACLRQIDRPFDLRNLAILVSTFENMAASPRSFEDIVSHAKAGSNSYLSLWLNAVQEVELPPHIEKAVKVISDLMVGSLKPDSAIRKIIDRLKSMTNDPGLQEDLSAWGRLYRSIDVPLNPASLGQFLQGLDIRPKNPDPEPGSVSLATIHGVKGLEFDTVYLIGLAEEILPSWHSVQQENGSAALEEERRACFVAITRTKDRLVLSRANQYKNHPKAPSRFLGEMGL